jgi:hypothetical protein
MIKKKLNDDLLLDDELVLLLYLLVKHQALEKAMSAVSRYFLCFFCS